LEQFKKKEQAKRRSVRRNSDLLQAFGRRLSFNNKRDNQEPFSAPQESRFSATGAIAGGSSDACSDPEQACLAHEEAEEVHTATIRI